MELLQEAAIANGTDTINNLENYINAAQPSIQNRDMTINMDFGQYTDTPTGSLVKSMRERMRSQRAGRNNAVLRAEPLVLAMLGAASFLMYLSSNSGVTTIRIETLLEMHLLLNEVELNSLSHG